MQTCRIDVAEVQAQAAHVLVRVGEERLARHKGHVLFQRRLEQSAGIERLLEGQPEEQTALGHMPVSQIREMLFQRQLKTVTAHAVEITQFGQVITHFLGADPLQGVPLALSPRELAVLRVLVQRSGEPFSKQQILDRVFSDDEDVHPEAVEVFVHRLRKRLEGSDVRITTLRGLGYALECN